MKLLNENRRAVSTKLTKLETIRKAELMSLKLIIKTKISQICTEA
jgi:hypothetical protein